MTRTAAPRRPHRRSAARLTAIVAAATVVALGGAGGTLAYLRDSAAVASGATIRAGSLDLLVHGATSAHLGTVTLTPGTGAAYTVPVSTTGAARATVSGTVTTTGDAALAAAVRLRAVEVPTAGACHPTTTGGVDATLATFPQTSFLTLEPASTRNLCLVLLLPAGADATLANRTLTLTLDLVASQIP